jgi:pentatricopeptide repeat protein
MSVEKYTKNECHKIFAIELNNIVWGLLGKTERSEDEVNEMINAAHASLYHWSLIGTELNLQRGEWMCSHVYAVLGRGKSALYHAERCLMYTEKNSFLDFDLAYAYESLARAHAASGNIEEAKDYFEKALKAGNVIKKEEDKKLFMSDLNTGPWYGIL